MAERNLEKDNQFLDRIVGERFKTDSNTTQVEKVETTETEKVIQPTETEKVVNITETETTEKVDAAKTDTTEVSETEKVDTVKDDSVTESSLTELNNKVKTTFGYDSIDDLLRSDVVSKVKEYESLKQSIEKMKQENDGYLEEFKSLNNPFSNEQVFKVNHLLKENPEMTFDVASKLVGSDLSAMSDIDKIILFEKTQDSELSDRLIERKIKREFGIDSLTDLDDVDEDTKIDIELRARKAAKELKSKMPTDLKMPETYVPENIKSRIETDNAAKAERVAKLEETWKPVAEHIKANFNEVPLNLWDNKKNSVSDEAFSKYVLDDKDKERYSSLAIDYAKSNGLTELTKENIEAVNVYIYQNLLMEKYPRLLQIVADKATSDAIAKYEIERDNPPITQSKDKKLDKGLGKDFRSAVKSKLLDVPIERRR